MPHCLLALGANLGDSHRSIEAALDAIEAMEQTSLLRRSDIHNSAPVGGPTGQAEFANAVALVDTSLSPESLLSSLQRVEIDLGRERKQLWDARTIDIDLLLYEQQVIDSPRLVLPHPRMSFRPFVLAPALEFARDWHHPTLQLTIGELWTRLRTGEDCIAIHGSQADRDWITGWLGGHVPRLLTDQPCKEPKLTIAFCESGKPLEPGGPTLRLALGSRDESLFDVKAALECVWPDALSGGTA